MAWWAVLGEAAGALVALGLLFLVALFARRRWIGRSGGTFELSCRLRTGPAGRGWTLGVGRYTGDDLEWFRIFSLSPRPRRVWRRAELSLVARREPHGPEALALYPGHLVVECRYARERLDLAMDLSSLTGFQAWLEAAPPGARVS